MSRPRSPLEWPPRDGPWAVLRSSPPLFDAAHIVEIAEGRILPDLRFKHAAQVFFKRAGRRGSSAFRRGLADIIVSTACQFDEVRLPVMKPLNVLMVACDGLAELLALYGREASDAFSFGVREPEGVVCVIAYDVLLVESWETRALTHELVHGLMCGTAPDEYLSAEEERLEVFVGILTKRACQKQRLWARYNDEGEGYIERYASQHPSFDEDDFLKSVLDDLRSSGLLLDGQKTHRRSVG